MQTESRYVLVLAMILLIAVYIKYQNKLEGYQNIKRRQLGYDGLVSGMSPPWVIDDKTKRIASTVVTGILNEINVKYNTNFQIMKFDYIKHERVESGTHYIVDVFAHDKRINEEMAVTKRFIMDFILLTNGGIQVNIVNSSNAKLPALGPSATPEWNQPIDNPMIHTDEALLDDTNDMKGGYESSTLEWSEYKTDVKQRGFPLGVEYKNTILPVHLQEQYWHDYKRGMNNKAFAPIPYGDTRLITKNTWLFEPNGRAMNRGNH